ncbi:MAG: hypothetical protein K2G02_01265 [Phocaeicola sp.]|nr:hypothetical protein [Phocaeicola sp.]
MMIDKRKIRSFAGLLCAGLLLLTACKDDDFYKGKYCPEGEPATISLKISVPQMDVKTRAGANEDATVNSLWIGIYNVRSGKCTYNAIIDNTEEKKEHELYTLSDVKTFSGESRIVAVANVRQNYGYCNEELIKEDDTSISVGTRSFLSELLLAADTWDKYTAIAAAHVNPGNISSYGNNQVMAGVYQTYGGGTSNDDGWNNGQTIDIQPGSNSLEGAIHLRRLLSYVKFNLFTEPGEGIKNLTVKLKSWAVCNVPTLSYLHEQEGNVGDVATYLETTDKSGIAGNYASSTGSFDFANETQDDRSYRTFEFHQYENKHTGILVEDKQKYNYREEEYIGGEGNTGIYKSLCQTEDINDPNNFASYVKIDAEVSYDFQEDDATVHRTGIATYYIHLGYCEGDNEATKANDFNCRRNTKYTYNVTIKGMDKIVVEAKKEDGEYQHGAEGEVYDTSEKVINLDAHYNVFNIQLSNKERANLEYLIRAPYGNEVKEVRREKKVDSNEFVKTGEELKQFHQWIQFFPTDEKGETLAEYKPDEVWSLEQLITQFKEGEDQNDETQKWYTVFVNENVYYGDPTTDMADANTGNEVDNEWWKYVNKEPRTIYISIQQSNVSADQDSRYGHAKYVINQKSIQTYYNTEENVHSSTAIGVEHINESSGLTLRWTSEWNGLNNPQLTGEQANSVTGWNSDNGRWNVWYYLTHNQRGGRKPLWNYFASMTQIAKSPAITNDKTGTFNKVATQYPVFQITSRETTTTTQYDPRGAGASEAAYHPMDLCLSRNRDLNGNGKIDENELRWYLPAMGKYARIVLGRNSLETPLIDPTHFDPTSFGQRAENSMFHYVSSGGMILWAEEGLSVEKKWVTGVENSSAWEVRCIRNLGVNLTQVVDEDPIERAYTHNSTERTFEMTHYDQASVRQQAITGTGMPLHSIIDPLNLPYKKFQYARKDCSSIGATTDDVYVNGEGKLFLTNYTSGFYGIEMNTSGWKESVANNAICGQYYEGREDDPYTGKGCWRVPNQKELTMIRREKLLNASGGQMWNWISSSYAFLDADNVDKYVVGVYHNNGRDRDPVYYGNNAALEYYGYNNSPHTFTHVRCVRDVVE